MKTLIRSFGVVAIGAAVCGTPVAGQGLAVQAFVGTQGLGAGVAVGLTPKLVARGSYGVIPTDPELTVDEFDFTIDFPSFMRATIDFYPTGFFFLSAGGLFVSRGGEIQVHAEVTGPVGIGGTTYSAAEVGTLDGTFGLSGSMPYLGLGFGNPVGRRVGLVFDLGVGIGSAPTVGLASTGSLASDPTFQARLREEEIEIAADIPEMLKYYPIVSLSLSISLGG
jgi:hypothetical protein